ncbi:50S ribosomal protein L15 [Patescibacteria group bacterium]|nr:50S ribosomal protein L15 [Patescibacteria group bacterium]MBU1663116.1 50S ribosomal protein L15 [Patescibacteria group bacterium]MBU1933703.1 50S ribosomal protein L15 [Patescibacteria group bacterium]MBU2008015.1 50S ribosomal protein L15 [Patescibacteria group bacterium]MBU2233700.1 50S ribosomal protein L15 [Patescibacteria group bacterium]
MSLSLHTIRPARGSVKKKKRIGRGNASGHGSYSTRGQKGQRSRSGGRNKLKRLGFKQILAATPKNRGFKSAKPKNQVVNLQDLNVNFSANAKINAASLLKAGLVRTDKEKIKILGQGELILKNLEFEGVKLSHSAKLQIEKMGGKINW